MQRIDVYGVVSGDLIDSITISGSRVEFANGAAEEIFRSKKGLYQTNARTFKALAGSSNGYLEFRVADQPGRVAVAE